MLHIASIVFFSNLQAIVHTFQRLLGVEHVLDTTSDSLKRYIDAMFVKHNLSMHMSRLREQGYDGAKNMRGELHGLNT